MQHIVPVFMRVLAGAFVQAGLLPRNHPGLMYGIQGVKKYGFSELVGEAWFTLRTTHAGPQQWGVFISVMLLIAMILGSLVTMLMTVAFGFGTSAQAQLFQHPLGATDIASMPAPSGPFDLGVPDTTTAHGDFGIMLIDKVIRQGANGSGVPLQNATQALMQTYNSGVLVVASIMLFWSILSVVVDTAKTGTVGGGRHNMVWAPIRIVFALGLLIPLGTNGYSSGQYMVMKLAEWGSNLGTNAWTAYIDGVIGSSNLVAQTSPYSPASLITAYQQMWICRVAYNGMSARINGTDQVTTVVNTQIGQTTFASKDRNWCGAYTVAPLENPVVLANPYSPTIPLILNNMITFRNGVRDDYVAAFNATTPAVRNFACQFVASFPEFADTAPLAGECGAVAAATALPPVTTFETIVTNFGTAIETAFNTRLATYTSDMNGGDIQAAARARGWAGMGLWYHMIGQINASVHSAQIPPINFVEGQLVPYVEALIADGKEDTIPEIEKFTHKTMGVYSDWWSVTPVYGAAAAPLPPNPSTGVAPPTAQPQQKKGLLASIGSAFSGAAKAVSNGVKAVGNAINNLDPKNLMNSIVDALPNVKTAIFSVLVSDTSGLGTNSNTYPMAMLANIGGNLLMTGVAIMGGVALFDSVLEMHIIEFLSKIGTSIMVAGMMLKFYIPMIPFIRCAFSVLTWIISVFEAVALVPIAALAHLTTEGDGIAGGAKQAWLLWLNVLLRPVLTVVGYVGAILVFNGFVAFFNSSFVTMLEGGLPSRGIEGFFQGIFGAITYVFIIYTAANTTFKMLDLVPSALMRWIGGTPDQSFDNDDKAMMIAASNMISGMRFGKGKGGGAAPGGGVS